MDISKTLVKLRQDRNITQQQLADQLNVTRQAISKWECGTALPDLEMIKKISSLYSISIDDLIDYHQPDKELHPLGYRDDAYINNTIFSLSAVIIVIIICAVLSLVKVERKEIIIMGIMVYTIIIMVSFLDPLVNGSFEYFKMPEVMVEYNDIGIQIHGKNEAFIEYKDITDVYIKELISSGREIFRSVYYKLIIKKGKTEYEVGVIKDCQNVQKTILEKAAIINYLLNRNKAD